MTTKEQYLAHLRKYLKAKSTTLLIDDYFAKKARHALHCLGGMAGSWRTDYSECTYYCPQIIEGVAVDISTVEKIRSHYEQVAA